MNIVAFLLLLLLPGSMKLLFAARSQRQHRLRNLITTLVRLPESGRGDVNKIESMLVRTKKTGGYAPLGGVATINKVLGPAIILRRKGQRVEKVGAEFDQRRIFQPLPKWFKVI